MGMFCAGTSVSLDVTNQLLDLISFYGDQDPVHDAPEQKAEETVSGLRPRNNLAVIIYKFMDYKQRSVIYPEVVSMVSSNVCVLT